MLYCNIRVYYRYNFEASVLWYLFADSISWAYIFVQICIDEQKKFPVIFRLSYLIICLFYLENWKLSFISDNRLVIIIIFNLDKKKKPIIFPNNVGDIRMYDIISKRQFFSIFKCLLTDRSSRAKVFKQVPPTHVNRHRYGLFFCSCQ